MSTEGQQGSLCSLESLRGTKDTPPTSNLNTNRDLKGSRVGCWMPWPGSDMVISTLNSVASINQLLLPHNLPSHKKEPKMQSFHSRSFWVKGGTHPDLGMSWHKSIPIGSWQIWFVSWPLACVNEVLLEHSHANTAYGSAYGIRVKLSSCDRGCMACKASKYFLFGSFQKKFADPSPRWSLPSLL